MRSVCKVIMVLRVKSKEGKYCVLPTYSQEQARARVQLGSINNAVM